MDTHDHIRSRFVQQLSRPEPAIELARAAMLVAAEADPGLDVEGALRTLDAWAAELQGRIDPQWNSLQRLARLRAFMFDDLGFRGERKDYYSPSNSLLHEVMQRRRGVPLTLSIIFMELGWRIGVPLEGVGFPGHFLVRLTGEVRDLLLDPFQRGMSVHEEDCARMLSDMTGGKLAFERQHVASVGKRDMIARLLLNLKGAYLRAGQDERALAAVEWLLLIHPEDLEEIRDRGLLLYRLERFGAALASLTEYLEKAPDAPDREAVEKHAATLRRSISSLN